MTIGGGGVDREVFYQGGHNDDPSTNTVELLDLGAAHPGWQVRRVDAPSARPLRQRAAPGRTRPRRRRQLHRQIRCGGRSGAADRALRPGEPTPGPSSRRSTARTCTTRPRSCCPTAASCAAARTANSSATPTSTSNIGSSCSHLRTCSPDLGRRSPPPPRTAATDTTSRLAAQPRARSRESRDPRRRRHPQLPHGPALRRTGDPRHDRPAS